MTTTELTKKDMLLEKLNELDFSNEPIFYQDLRKKALTELENLDLPTSKTEYWKYTRLGKIVNNSYQIGVETEVSINQFFIQNLDANILVLVNGIYYKSNH